MAFTVSDGVLTILAQRLQEANPKPGQVIRLARNKEGKLKFLLDQQKNDDQVISRKGVAVLVLEPSLQETFAAKKLDIVEREGSFSWKLVRA